MRLFTRIANTALVLCLVCAPLAAATACSSDDSGDSGGSTKVKEGSTSKQITAADGGTLEDVSGTASLAIPAGALEGDTQITVATTNSDDTDGPIYDYGPDGTKFSKPATLAIEWDGKVPEDKKAVLATYEDGKWVEIAGSKYADGKVTGPVSHFSKFSIIIIGNTAVAVSECSKIAADFEPCGGDPKGTWTFAEFCFDNFNLGNFGGSGQCTGAKVDMDVTMEGEIEITATQVIPGPSTSTMKMNMSVPKSCIGTDCTALESEPDPDDGESGQTCTDEGDTCSCSSTQTNTDTDNSPEDYKVVGNTLVVTDADGDTVHEFCVNGDTMDVRIEADDDQPTTIVYRLKRK
jgi:hypothetical protein